MDNKHACPWSGGRHSLYLPRLFAMQTSLRNYKEKKYNQLFFPRHIEMQETQIQQLRMQFFKTDIVY